MITLREKMEIVEELLDAAGGIGFWHFDGNGVLLRTSVSDAKFISDLMELSGAETAFRNYVRTNLMPAILTDEFYMTWIVVPHTVETVLKEVYLIGPVYSSTISEQHVLHRIYEASAASILKEMPVSRLKEIPVISHQILMHYAMMLYRLLYNQPLSQNRIQLITDRTEQSGPERAEKQSADGDYRIMEEILHSVEKGDINYVRPQSTLLVQVGTMSRGNPQRQAKVMIITAITRVTDAAIRGGLPVAAAYALSDEYILRLEQCNTLTEIYQIWQDALKNFTQQVYSIQTAAHSPMVNHCIFYVRSHIEESISLSDLALQAGYNQNYLCSLFCKEMGMPLRSYIMDQKLELAAIRLKNSRDSVSSIAHRLSFESISYFSAQFRKKYGCTPTEYRETSLS